MYLMLVKCVYVKRSLGCVSQGQAALTTFRKGGPLVAFCGIAEILWDTLIIEIDLKVLQMANNSIRE